MFNITQVHAAEGNYGKGRAGKKIEFIVMHWMAGTIAGADARFTKAGEQASAHYGIGGAGEVHQYVDEVDTAYHAGNLDINRRSIGIEHQGGPDTPLTEAMYQTSAQLVRDICLEYNLPINRDTLHPHKEYKATQCPGTLDIDRIIKMANENGDEDMKFIEEHVRPFIVDDVRSGENAEVALTIVMDSPETYQKLTGITLGASKQLRPWDNLSPRDNVRPSAINQVLFEVNDHSVFLDQKLTEANAKIADLERQLSQATDPIQNPLQPIHEGDVWERVAAFLRNLFGSN